MIFRFILFVCIITFIQIGPSTATAHELNERLQTAIATEDIQTVKNIIYQIKDIDSVRNWVGTPLHNAAFTRSLDIIKILVENGADINAKNQDGKTPLHCAAYVGSVKILKYFVEDQKVDPNQADNEGRKPIHYSASRGSLVAVQYLVNHGAKANEKDFNGVMPLHEAASFGSLPLVKYLYESQNAELNAIDKRHGFTPLHYAAMSKSTEVAIYLIGFGADMTVRDYRGNTILHIAAFSGAMGIVRYLVEEKNANIDLINNEKLRPIDLAGERQHDEIVRFLEHKNKK